MNQRTNGTRRLIGWAAIVAAASAAVGVALVANAGHDVTAQVAAAAAAVVLLGAGSVVALAVGVPSTLWRARGNDDWSYW